jgi:ribosome biogenesis GTPase A
MCDRLAWHVEAMISDGALVDRVAYWKTSNGFYEALITYRRPEKENSMKDHKALPKCILIEGVNKVGKSTIVNNMRIDVIS